MAELADAPDLGSGSGHGLRVRFPPLAPGDGRMDDTILVTGAAGFIGSHTCERLVADGRRVVGVDNFCDFYPRDFKRRNLERLMTLDRFEFVEADIRDTRAMDLVFSRSRPRAVLHFAALVGVRPSLDAAPAYCAVNVEGTANVLDASRRHGVSRFVFASSSSVYGDNAKVPFHEDDPVDHPVSPYAATKRAGELLCRTCSHLYGLSVVCLRFFTVFGPRQRPDLAIAKFLRLTFRGEEIPVFGDGETSRDYTYIDDIVDGVVVALRRDDPFRIYNLGGNRPVRLLDLVAVIERVTGRTARIRRMPRQPGDVARTYADIERARKELGFAPKVGLEEGIARQWAWFLSAADGAGEGGSGR